MRASRSWGVLVALTLLIVQPSVARSNAARAAREGAYMEWTPAAVLRSGPDTLVVLNPESSRPETLAVARLGIVEVEAGRHVSASRMLIGFAAGVLLGGLTGAAIYGATEEDLGGEIAGIGALYYFAIGAAAGGSLGLVAGSYPVNSWDRYYVSPDAQRWLASKTWPYTGP